LFEVIKVGLRSIATVIYATIKLVDQLAKVAIYSFNAIDKALKGDYAGAGKALSKGFTSGIGQAQEDFKAIQRMWTDAPSPGTGRRTGGTAADLSAMGVSGAAAQPFKLSSRGQALVAAAKKLGVSPLDLATIIDFETGGAYNPSMMGGAGGNYMGLIQFGASERQQYGAYKGQSFEEQVQGPVVRFLKDRFASVDKSTEGASLLSLYRTVLGGNPKANINAQDAFGTSPASGVARMGANRRRALDTFFGGTIANVPYGAIEAGGNAAQRFEAEAKIIEERTKQLRAAQQASRSAANELEILQTISPIKKIQVEYDQKRGQLINEYNDKMKQSKSDEESSYYLGERSARLAILEVQEKSALKNVQDELLQQDRERLKLIEEFTKIIEERLTRTSIGAGFKQGLNQYIEQIGTLRDSISGMTTQAFKGLEDQLAALATTGKANFADFAQSIIADMSRIIIQQTIMKPLLSALGGLFPSPSAAGGLGSFGFTIPSLMANGGIMTSMGAMPLRTYAGGGIASSPQMALFGEGSMNEAYVPLPDGRRIPVAMQGGGGGTSVVVNVDAKGTSVQGNGGRGDQLGKVLSAAVQAELIKQRRPGGLLA
jgi:lambda family phage tail tape measure protein